MRRHDREITNRQEIDAIIRSALVCRIALAAGDEPYVVPVSFGYDGDAIYIHTAKSGRKIEFIEANNRASSATAPSPSSRPPRTGPGD